MEKEIEPEEPLVPENWLEIADMKLKFLELDYEKTIQAENTAKPLLCEDDESEDEDE